MKKQYLMGIFLVLMLSVLALPLQMVRAEDGRQETEQSEADKKAAEAAKEAAKKAVEQAKKEAERLAGLRKKAEEARREAAKKAAEEQQQETEQDDAQSAEDESKKEAFKKACENQRESFKTRLEATASGVQRRSEKLNTLVDVIQQYVTTHNLVVDNYSQLLTNVETKRELTQKIYEASKESASDFTCESQGAAKDSVLNFKDAVRQEVDALGEYKTAVQALIAAVRSAARAAEGGQ